MPRSFTRCFSISKAGLKRRDFSFLFRVCDRIDACLVYKIVRNGKNRNRLEGYILLRGLRAHVDQLIPLFPNCLLTATYPENYIFTGYRIRGHLPFHEIKRSLFT
jgi:hypothetical protein